MRTRTSTWTGCGFVLWHGFQTKLRSGLWSGLCVALLALTLRCVKRAWLGPGKGMEYGSLQQASPLRELTCHTGSHSVTCHPAEVTEAEVGFLYPSRSFTRFSDPGGTQGWVELVGLLHTVMVYPPEDGYHPSTNLARLIGYKYYNLLHTDTWLEYCSTR